MKKQPSLKRLFLSAMFVLVALAGMAQTTFAVGDLNYRVNDDGVSVTVTGHVNGTSATGELIIPESVSYGGSDYAVTVIGDNAFNACTYLNGDLVIPNSVVSIGESAFYYCYGFMGTLTLSDALETIGDNAFLYCTYMNGTLTLPNSLISIGAAAFAYCYGFTGDLVIPDAVTFIGESAFQICSGFNGTLTLGKTLTHIGDYAFNSCDGLTGTLFIPSCVESLGGNTFGYCAFDGIVVNAENSVYDSRNDCNAIITTSTNALITGCRSTVIPNTVTAIGDNAFRGCNGLTSIHIPHSVTHIGENAFAFCFDLAGDLVIPNAVDTIGASAFFQCESLNGALVIGESVAYIGDMAFRNCSAVTEAVTLAVTPPTLGDEFGGMAFAYFGDPSLTVPCGCEEAYQNSSWYDPYGMSGFWEFIEDCTEVAEADATVTAVYPNPTEGVVRIEAEGLVGIRVFNILGERVFEASASGDALEYDFGQHGAGVYLIQIETSTGIESRRLTVSHSTN